MSTGPTVGDGTTAWRGHLYPRHVWLCVTQNRARDTAAGLALARRDATPGVRSTVLVIAAYGDGTRSWHLDQAWSMPEHVHLAETPSLAVARGGVGKRGPRTPFTVPRHVWTAPM